MAGAEDGITIDQPAGGVFDMGAHEGDLVRSTDTSQEDVYAKPNGSLGTEYW